MNHSPDTSVDTDARALRALAIQQRQEYFLEKLSEILKKKG